MKIKTSFTQPCVCKIESEDGRWVWKHATCLGWDDIFLKGKQIAEFGDDNKWAYRPARVLDLMKEGWYENLVFLSESLVAEADEFCWAVIRERKMNGETHFCVVAPDGTESLRTRPYDF